MLHTPLQLIAPANDVQSSPHRTASILQDTPCNRWHALMVEYRKHSHGSTVLLTKGSDHRIPGDHPRVSVCPETLMYCTVLAHHSTAVPGYLHYAPRHRSTRQMLKRSSMVYIIVHT